MFARSILKGIESPYLSLVYIIPLPGSILKGIERALAALAVVLVGVV